MDEVLIDIIKVEIDRDALMKEVRIKEKDQSRVQSFNKIVDEASAVSRPKAVFRPLSVDKKDNGRVVMENYVFNSHDLAEKLTDVDTAFAFVSTCGTELADWAEEKTGLLEKFWADNLMQKTVLGATEVLQDHIRNHFGLEKTSFLRPVSPEVWPISDQQSLFAVFGDVHESIGVYLTPEHMMKPIYSISGIIFPTETE